jgi:hypothetical protein
MALMRLGEQGNKGINAAIADLKNTFVNLVTKDRADGSEGPEYERMVDGAAVKLCADRTPEGDRGCCGTQAKTEAPQEPPPAGQQGRWMNLDDYLDGTYTRHSPASELHAKTTSNSSTPECGTPTLPSPQPGNHIRAMAGQISFGVGRTRGLYPFRGSQPERHHPPTQRTRRQRRSNKETGPLGTRRHPMEMGRAATEIERLEVPPQLAVLDGINTACGMHDWAVKEPESVGLYRAMFVHPLTKIGAAVLSLGHPPKATNRQSEYYSYGAAGWLNDVDGVGYRMVASKHR